MRISLCMYEFFGGATRILTPDNLKVGILSNRKYENPVVNRSYQELADHYHTVLLPARVLAPRDYRRKNVIGNSMKDSQNTPIIRYL